MAMHFRNRFIGCTYHYFRPEFKAFVISLENLPLYGTVPAFLDPEIPIESMPITLNQLETCGVPKMGVPLNHPFY